MEEVLSSSSVCVCLEGDGVVYYETERRKEVYYRRGVLCMGLKKGKKYTSYETGNCMGGVLYMELYMKEVYYGRGTLRLKKGKRYTM